MAFGTGFPEGDNVVALEADCATCNSGAFQWLGKVVMRVGNTVLFSFNPNYGGPFPTTPEGRSCWIAADKVTAQF